MPWVSEARSGFSKEILLDLGERYRQYLHGRRRDGLRLGQLLVWRHAAHGKAA